MYVYKTPSVEGFAQKLVKDILCPPKLSYLSLTISERLARGRFMLAGRRGGSVGNT